MNIFLRLTLAGLFLTNSLFCQVPTITSFAPASGTAGTSVVLTGTNFSTNAANNIVFFGAAKATVTGTPTANSCTVTVPSGATYERITLSVGLFTGYSKKPFIVTSSCPPVSITTSDFDTTSFATSAGYAPQCISIADYDLDGKNDLAIGFDVMNYIVFRRNTSTVGNISSAVAVGFTVGNTPKGIANGDLNGDGYLDAVIYNTSDGTLSVMENTSTLGNISFLNPITLNTKSSGSSGDRGLCIGDLDGDGKPEIVGANGSTDSISILRNTISAANSTITQSGFAAAVRFASLSQPKWIYMADIDGDGKTDLVASNTFTNVAVFRNLSTIGTISFAAPVYLPLAGNPYDIGIGDIDLDGKPEIVSANNANNSFSILQNTSTSGNISFATKVDFSCGSNPRDARITDINGDGKPDVIVPCAGADHIAIFENTSTVGTINSSTFGSPVYYPFNTNYNVRMACVGDFDGDSKPDIISSSSAMERITTHRNLILGGPVMTSPSTKSICSGSGVNLTLTATPSSGTIYSWIAAANANVTGESTSAQLGSAITNTLVNTTTTPQTVIYTVTPTSTTTCGGGTPQPQIVTITVDPKPVMTNPSIFGICSGTILNISLTSGASATYNWIATDNPNTTGESTTNQSNSTINNTLTNTLTTAQTVVYTVTPTGTAGSCLGTAQTISVTVNPRPTMTSASSATVCSDVTLNIPLTSNITSTYSWLATNNPNTTGESTTATSGNTINNTINNSSVSTQLVIYTVTPTSTLGSCTGTAQTVTATVNAAPSMTNPNTFIVCSGTALNIPLTSNVASTYSWVATNNPNTTGESTTTQTTNTINNTITNTVSAQSVIYTITPTSTLGSCLGTAQTLTVTVNPLPNTAVNSPTICSGLTTTLTASGATTYSWSTSATTSTISVSPVSTAFYTVTGTSLGCNASKTATVTVNPIPLISVNSATICNGASTTLTASGAATYSWNPGGATTNTISVTPSSTTIYTLTGTSSGCSASKTATITVNALPVMTSGTSTSVCSGTALSFSLSSNIASTYTWIANNNASTSGESTSTTTGNIIDNTITSTATTPTTLIYTVTPISSGGSCVGTIQTITVTVNPQPTMTSASSTTTCNGTNVNLALTSSAASTFNWLATDNINVSGESITTQTATTISNTLTTTNSNTTTVVYTVTPIGTAGSCVGTPQVIIVSLDYAPTANAGIDSSLCTGTIYLYGNNPSPGTGVWAVNSITDGFTTVNIQTPTSRNSGAAFGGTFATNDKVTLKWTVSSPLSTCPNTIDSVRFTKISCPLTADFNRSPTNFCLNPGDSASVIYTDNSTPGAYAIQTYTWTFSGGNPSSYIGKTPPVIKYPYSASGSINPAQLQVTDGAPIPVTAISVVRNITINPKPSPSGPITGSITVCQGQSNVTYSVTPIVNASSYAWVFPSGTVLTTNNIQTTSFSTSAQSGSIKVAGINAACGTGDTSYLAITVNPLPDIAGPVTGSTTVCQGAGGVPYSISPIANATSYIWILPSGASIASGGTTNSITANYNTSAQTGVIKVVGINACGTSDTSYLTITVNPLPVAAGALTGSLTVCQNQLGVTYSVAPITNATSYTWTFLGAISSYSTTADTALVDFNSSLTSATIFVNGTNACGSGANTSISITVNSVPSVGIISGSATACQGQNGITYSISPVAGTTSYNWSFPLGASSVSSSNIASTDFDTTAQSGLITVAGVNTCGTGPASSYSVTVNPLPGAASFITGADTICQGQTGASYFVNPIANATTYSWTSPPGSTGIVTANNYSVNYSTSASSGIITVFGQNACGNGNLSSLVVTVNPLPIAPVFSGTLNVSLCPLPDSLLFSFNSASLNASSFNWVIPNGAYADGSITNDSIYIGFNSVAASDTIKVQSVNGCGSSAYSYQVLTPQSLNAPAICMLSVDSLSNYNYIYWNKTLYPSADSFIVYREVSTNIYLRIAAISVDSLSLFKDTCRSIGPSNGDPNIGYYHYKLQFRDTCGNYSPLSLYHTSVYFIDLQTGTFNWNIYDVEGQATPVSNFYLLRDDFNTGNYVQIGSVAGSTTVLNDPNYFTYQGIANWRVDADGFNCTPTMRYGNNNNMGTIAKARSNVKNNRVAGVNSITGLMNNIKLYPNPATDEITFELGQECNNCKIEIVNSLGETVKICNLNALTTKISVTDLMSGIYFIKTTQVNKPVSLQKLIIQQ